MPAMAAVAAGILTATVVRQIAVAITLHALMRRRRTMNAGIMAGRFRKSAAMGRFPAVTRTTRSETAPAGPTEARNFTGDGK